MFLICKGKIKEKTVQKEVGRKPGTVAAPGFPSGASGDIGFTPKASNTNGLRAIEQQYLHQNQISVLYFEGVPAMERFFSCPKQGRESLAIDQMFSYIILFL